MKAGITRESASAPSAYMFLWWRPSKTGQKVEHIRGLHVIQFHLRNSNARKLQTQVTGDKKTKDNDELFQWIQTDSLTGRDIQHAGGKGKRTQFCVLTTSKINSSPVSLLRMYNEQNLFYSRRWRNWPLTPAQ